MKVSVVITTYNEIETIDEFIKRTVDALSNYEDYELIFVDDRSTDSSLQKLIEHNKQNPKIKVVSMARRYGRHECYFCGFSYVTGEIVVTLDSDLQDPPELIPKMIDKLIEEDADLVYSVMRSRAGESLIKKLLTKISYKILNKISYVKSHENAGYFKVFKVQLAREILNVGEVDSYFKGLINWVGFNQIAYTYDRDARVAGKSHFPLWGTRPYKDFLKAVTSFSYVPLYKIFVIGFLGLVLSTITLFKSIQFNGVEVFIQRIIESPVISFMFFVSMLILFSLSIISLYLMQIHAASRNRPRYIVDKSWGVGGL